VLQNQQQLFPAENSLAQTQLNQLTVIVQLYKALGGGWQESEIYPLAQPNSNQVLCSAMSGELRDSGPLGVSVEFCSPK
jgi:hypothetical protein